MKRNKTCQIFYVLANISIINEDPFPVQFIIQLYYEFSNSTVIELLMRELLKNIPNSNRQQLPGIIHFWIGNSCHRYAQTTLIIDFDS
ncbi:unnamed protein product [Rotaria sordida]|uniref:Uncharacterized protein n=1 Tax=Rotaria sordida TaxID=392033 RepID=A0A815EWL3_9BILA|nr:unnamed protein product [Rotaria sordida]CAF1311716.1 unnamed protein product [Rotaria sordida]CAF1377829.1 unnamed protein product [Rotaria sordida]CAF1580346.1 unnamed protein product [Rotaria sordida]CAF3875386.1 unnamed protein product [Rotaria sordida]